jgi:hypothetical protein
LTGFGIVEVNLKFGTGAIAQYGLFKLLSRLAIIPCFKRFYSPIPIWIGFSCKQKPFTTAITFDRLEW